MSFALYGESQSYVHLVSAETAEKAVSLFLEDLREVGVELKTVLNIFAVEGNKENKELEDFVTDLIREAGK